MSNMTAFVSAPGASAISAFSSSSIFTTSLQPPRSLKQVARLKRRRVVFEQSTANVHMQSIQDDSEDSYPMNGSSYSYSSTPEDEANDTGTQPESEDSIVDAEVRDVPLNELKCELYAALSSVDRGFSITPELRTQVDTLLSQIERIGRDNVSLDEKQRTLFCGNWRLIYTNALDVLFLGLLSPLSVLTNQIYQSIEPNENEDENTYIIKNIIEFEPLISTLVNANSSNRRTFTKVTVTAKGEVQTRDYKSTALTFENVQVSPETVLGFEIPSQIKALSPNVKIGSPVGELETTYLDEDIRVGRAVVQQANLNSVFVFIREP